MSSHPTHLVHVAVYLRKSRADVEAEAHGEGETLSRHRRALLALARKHEYTIDDVYEEIVSGERIVDRPEMQKLLHTVQEEKYSAVLCMDIDRLGRGNMIDQGLIQDTFKSSGTLIITPRKVYNLQDEMDEEWSEFEAFMARRELKLINRRLQRGRKQSAGEGKSISKKPPYGYLRDDKLQLHPDPKTAPVVKLIFDMAARGIGASSVCNRLMDLRVPSPSGRDTWERSTIYDILKNPVYQGHIVWGRQKYVKSSGRKSGYTRIRTGQQTWTIRENAHEALVDKNLLEKYLTHVQRRPRVKTSTDLSNPLAGLVICAECGRSMRRQPRPDRPYDALHCGTPKCRTKGARFEIVEQRIIMALHQMLAGLDIVPGMYGQPKGVRRAEFELAERSVEQLNDALKQLRLQRGNLHDLLEQGVYDVSTFLDRHKVISEKEEALDRGLSAATGEMNRIALDNRDRDETAQRRFHVLDSYTSSQSAKLKNNLLKQIIDRIVYARPHEWSERDKFDLEIFLRI